MYSSNNWFSYLISTLLSPCIYPAATIIITECTIYGGSHFERCGNFNVKSHSSDDVTVAGLIKFENLDGQIKFDAKFGKPGTRMTLRDKTLLLGLSSICIYIEIAINYKKQTVRVTQITVMSIDGLDGKSSGLAWPLNKIADIVIERQLSQWKSNSQRNADQIKLFLNQYSSQWNLSDILSHINFSELLDWIKFNSLNSNQTKPTQSNWIESNQRIIGKTNKDWKRTNESFIMINVSRGKCFFLILIIYQFMNCNLLYWIYLWIESNHPTLMIKSIKQNRISSWILSSFRWQKQD